MKLRLEFLLHWVFTITFLLLVISGLAMVGARFGWILSNDIATADFVHRVIAVPYVLLTFIALLQESIRVLKDDSHRDLDWSIFGRNGYGLFTLLTTLMFIVTGIVLWKSHHGNMKALAFTMYVHEKLTFIVLASLIWHIYQKSHVLMWPKQVIRANLMTQRWFKVTIWFLASAFFFSTAAVMISFGAPEPTEQQVMAFMSGMMQAMHQSLMGIAAMDSGDNRGIMELSGTLLANMPIIAIFFAALLVWRGTKTNEPK